MAIETTEIVDRFLSALAAGDLDGVAACFDADSVEFLVPHAAGIPWIPDTNDRVGVRSFFAELAEQLVSESFEIDSRVIDGAEAALRGRLRSTVRATGRTIESPFVIWLTVEDGSIVRYHQYEDNYFVAHAAGVAEPAGGG